MRRQTIIYLLLSILVVGAWHRDAVATYFNQVEGTKADGASAGTARPVIQAGVDGSGNVQSLSVNTAGEIIPAPLADTIDSIAIGANASVTGAAVFRDAALTNTDVAVKGTSGRLYGWHLHNTNASVVFVQVYNDTAANVTVGTTTPVISLALPASGTLDSVFAVPVAFSTAITIACTTTATGSTAPGTAIVANLIYK